MATPVNPGTTPSLPGAMASRTDGGPASKQAIRYAAGEPGAEDFVNLQRQAAMAKTPDAKGMAPSQIQAAAAQGGQPDQSQQQAPMANAPQAIPLGAPSAYPDQHVTDTSGVVLGNPAASQYQDAHAMFTQMASDPNASPAMKYLAMRIGQGF